MLAFKDYLLTEAKFNPRDMRKVMGKLTKVLSRRLNVKFYPYNGNGEIELTGNGKNILSFLYFFRPQRAIRFNTYRGELFSIDLWRHYIHGNKPEFTIRFEGMNIIQIFNHLLSHLIDIIKQPKVQTIPFYFLPEQQEQPSIYDFLSEATNVKNPEDFYKMAMAVFGGKKDLDKLSWSDINYICTVHDVRCPGWVRASKHGARGNPLYSVVPPVAATVARNNQPEPTYYIKVSKQDPESGRFNSIKDDRHALDLTAQLAKAVNATIPMQGKRPDPKTLFGRMQDLVRLVARGVNPSLFIYGGAGTGKTFLTTQAIKDESLTKGIDWFMVKGKVTPVALYTTLYTHRQKGKLIVFDDADSAFADGDAANILKAALDSYDERTISWLSARTANVGGMSAKEKAEYMKKVDNALKDDPNARIPLPNEFTFEGRVIFISNLPAEKVDSAILSRSYKIDMTLTTEEMFQRMEGLLDEIERDVPLAVKKEVLHTLRERKAMGDIDYVSMRTFVAGIKIANSGLPNWQDLIAYT